MRTRPLLPVILVLSTMLALATHSIAQVPSGVRLNEFMADNVTIAPDNADFDDASDWIELHNPTASAVSLAGYYLTDDLGAPTKWAFPAGASIAAGGHLIVRADGFDAGPGETHVREFSPWADFTTLRLHTNFKLSAEGEELGLFRFDGVAEDVALVSLGATWRYLDDGTDPGAGWMLAAYDATAWPVGAAQLGYGENDQATTIGYGGVSSAKHPAYYFRHTFAVADPGSLAQIELSLLADDGAVVYLNGTEILRVRMPAGAPTYRGFAAGLATENVYDLASVAADLLVVGENLLAVEVHQESATSSDVSFNLSLAAKRLVGTTTAIDTLSFGQQYPDVSWARTAADPALWSYAGEPTPGAANSTPSVAVVASGPAVAFSLPGGFYVGAQSLALSASGGATIRYTLDGSVPASSSPAYTTPLAVNATTVVRARAFADGHTPGRLATQTYFIDEPARNLPVVSLVTAPEVFFDATLGIYRNNYKGREAPVHLEFFEAGGTPGFSVAAGAKIAGENIWRFAQKPLTLTLRGKYGDDLIGYQLFPDAKVGGFSQIVLRNGGDDCAGAMLRDGMTPHLLRGQSPSDVQDYRPAVAYLNGAYWGVYDVREKLDSRYFLTRHHIYPGTYDYLQFAHTIGDAVSLVVAEGDTDAYLALEALATSTDLSQPINYAAVAAQIDVDSLVDFVAAEDFVNNTSWRHNREFWRERRDGAKWHWVVTDLDRGYNSANLSTSLIDNMKADYPLFAALVTNTAFRQRLAQRYAAHLATTFHPQRISDTLARLDAEVLPEMPRHIARWKDESGTYNLPGIPSLASREAELAEIRSFATQRATGVFAGIANHLGYSATAQLTLDYDATRGRLLVEGVPVPQAYTSTLKLFRDVPLTLTAEPAPGFAFAGWSDGLGAAPELALTLVGDRTLTATFVPSGETVLPATITSDTTLTLAGSPYTTAGDLEVAAGVTLTIEAGVSLLLPADADLLVRGALIIAGSAEAPVNIAPRVAGRTWGAISFVDATGASTLAHLAVRGGTLGDDPVNLRAALSNLRSTLVIEHADIEGPTTIFARGGSTTLRDSRIAVTTTGDGINIKGGAGLVERCTFPGNTSPDTDAIDFDGVTDGIIRDNRIYAFRGPNSDGIDVGEGCVNLLVTGNRIFHNSDKGVSVGQGSEVRITQNLIVGCVLGVGLKDTGSLALIDQNTFVRCDTGVAAYEKNLGAGGATATVTNTIFSRSRDAAVSADALSAVTVGYSLADNLTLPGAGNLRADPLFTDAGSYDFSLAAGSPAINAGDPAHIPDPDATRADIGAAYVYSAEDYPFPPPNVIVINEVLAHSQDAAPDWIELHNSSDTPIDIGGWYLSDDLADLQKYRIAAGTVLPARGYLVFNEHDHFGASSPDAGALAPFALSENGETLCLYAPVSELALEYLETEDFGASATNVSFGRHFKASTQTTNFVAMAFPTPGFANSAPLTGPIVISEIMYHPAGDAAAEYLELTNISSAPVTLLDAASGAAWTFTAGITHTFPTASPLTLESGERLVLTRNVSTFLANYTVPAGTRVLAWTSGALDNAGETVELSAPGGVNNAGVRQYIRIDRVVFSDQTPWPAAADGDGPSLTRTSLLAYGNDSANWIAAAATPGGPVAPLPGFAQWAASAGLGSEAEADSAADPDGDGLANLLEYAFGTSPTAANASSAGANASGSPEIDLVEGYHVFTYSLAGDRGDLEFAVETTADLATGIWSAATDYTIEPTAAGQLLRAYVPADAPRLFIRLQVTRR